MEYEVNLDEFNGPLDLLLHLIKKSKVNIWNIKLEIIIDQYLEYLKKFEKINLNIASSYLVMASELVEIKSRMLLPSQDTDEEEEDPKEKLINKLIEYQRYKELTDEFKTLREDREDYFTKDPSNLVNYVDESKKVLIENVTTNDLIEAFSRFLKRTELDKPLKTKVTSVELSIDDRKKYIRDKLLSFKKVNFFDLFEVKNREYVIVTFLAILDMASKDEIIIIQENNFDNIYCEAR
jgi:segregation and condensation protein A